MFEKKHGTPASSNQDQEDKEDTANKRQSKQNQETQKEPLQTTEDGTTKHDIDFEESLDERKIREAKENDKKKFEFNLELSKYMGSGPDALNWSVFIDICSADTLDIEKYIQQLYEHGIRSEFGLRRLVLQDFQTLRLPIKIRQKIMKWQEERNEHVQGITRGWIKEAKTTDQNRLNQMKNATSFGDWLEQSYLLHLDKGSEETNKYILNTFSHEIKYTELYHKGRDQLFYKEEQIEITNDSMKDSMKDSTSKSTSDDDDCLYSDSDDEYENEYENKTKIKTSTPPPIPTKYYFKRPTAFKKLIPTSKDHIESKQKIITQWEIEEAEKRTGEKYQDKEEELPQRADAVHTVAIGFDTMKMYFKNHRHEFGALTNSQMEQLYMIMDVIEIPIGGTIVKKDEIVTFLGFLFDGKLQERIPPDDGDILGKDVIQILPSDSIIGAAEMFTMGTPPLKVSLPLIMEEEKKNGQQENVKQKEKETERERETTKNKTLSINTEDDDVEEEEEEISIVRTANVIVVEDEKNNMLNADHINGTNTSKECCIMGMIPFEKLDRHPDLKTILTHGCGVRVIEQLKNKLKPKKPTSPKKKKGKKGKKNKRPDSPKKTRSLSIDEEDYDTIDEEEVMYRVWIHRARETLTTLERRRDPIELKFEVQEKERIEFEKNEHWKKIILNRELNLLRHYQAASVTLMNGVKSSFHPLKNVIKKTMQKNFSKNLLKKLKKEKQKEEKEEKVEEQDNT